MPHAPWQSLLARALHRNRSLAYARYAQLATVRSDGRPANRTIVFRGFLDQASHQLKFISDARSEKQDQITAQPWGELCWYFPNSREQFRLFGRLTLVPPDHPDPGLLKARQQQWQDLSDAARLQFAWADPGEPRDPEDRFDPTAPDPVQPLANFCLLLLDPVRVDHLELRGDPQNRSLYTRENDLENDQMNWMIQSVNP